VADDIMEGIKGFSIKSLPKLDDYLREAEFIRSSELYKERGDNIKRFYYFFDKEKKVYYNVAESVTKHKGIEHKQRFLYSITKYIPKK
jgi:uncharacterized protein YhbP (UPF0306 family)